MDHIIEIYLRQLVMDIKHNLTLVFWLWVPEKGSDPNGIPPRLAGFRRGPLQCRPHSIYD